MGLDVPTVVFSTMTVSVILSLYFWLRVGKSGPWVKQWALANTLATGGLICFLGQGRWSPWISVVLANWLVLGSYLLLETGLRKFANHRFNPWVLWTHVGAMAVLFPLFTFVFFSFEARVWVHAAVAMSIFFRIIFMLVTKISEIRSRYRLLVDGFAGSLSVIGLYYVVHGFLVLGHGIQFNLSQNWSTGVIFLLAQVMVLLWTLGFSSLDHLRTQNELQLTLATRDRLFSLIAHDLKGPVGNVAVMLQSMVEDGYDEADLEASLALTASAAEDSFRLLENLLDWARAQRGAVQVDIKPLPAADLVQTVVKTLRPLAESKGQGLTVDVAPDLVLTGDASTLAAVFRNLISNAIKFSPKKASVEVRGRSEGPWAVIEVADHGLGLPPGLAETVDRGALPESTRGTGGERGTGLGLSLCHEFLKLNGGTLAMDTGSGGTKVTVRVPLGTIGS